VHASDAHAVSALTVDPRPADRTAASAAAPVRTWRLFAACLTFGLATAASVFMSAMAVAQPGDTAAQFVIVRTMYAGHDGMASCPGIGEVKADSGDQVTYCYEMTNPSAAALDRVAFVDSATGADTSFMSIAAGEVPVPAGGTVMWAFETRSATALAGPSPTPTSEPTETPQPSPTPAPTRVPSPTPAATVIPTATAEAVVVVTTPTPGPTAIPADPTATAIPADPTAIAVLPSAPAPPAASDESSILNVVAAVEGTGATPLGTSGSQTSTALGDQAFMVDPASAPADVSTAAETRTVSESGRPMQVPLATSSGWRLGNTTGAMVLSVLIAVAAGAAAGIAFWRSALHLQKRRSALYWYERLAV